MTLRTSQAIKRHFQSVLQAEQASRRAPEHPRPKHRRTPSISGNSQASDLKGSGENENENESENHDADNEDEGTFEDNDTEPRDIRSIPHPIYSQGRTVYEDEFYKVYVKAVSHRQRTRYSLSDHLFDLKVIPKENHESPFLIDLEEVLEKGLVHVLERLQDVYSSARNQNQIYVTVVEENILHGLNSGNYSLHTPARKIARWVLGMLYNYLKSKQTLQLNKSFKIQIKVLSHRHTTDLEKKRTFNRHVYH